MDKHFFKAAILAGLIGGAVFMMLEMILLPVFNMGSPWGPPHLIAAIALGKDVLPKPGQPVGFEVNVVMVGMLIHFILSIVFTFIIGGICKTMRMTTALLIGAVFGLALYFINFYGFTAIFPWFAKARNWVTIFSHVMFGVVAIYTFKKIYTPIRIT